MFKSGRNLSSMLTSRNKPKLPPNSLPGVYRIPCKCCGRYVGHTGKQISTRDTEHQKAVFIGNTRKSGGRYVIPSATFARYSVDT